MKNLRQMCAATVLMLALTVSVFAGQIDCPGAPSPGDMPTVGTRSPGDVSTSGPPSPGSMPTCGLAVLLAILDLAV